MVNNLPKSSMLATLNQCSPAFSVSLDDNVSTPDMSQRPRRKSANYDAGFTNLVKERRDSFFDNAKGKGYAHFGRRRPAGERHGTKYPKTQNKKMKIAQIKSATSISIAKQKNNLFRFWGKPKPKGKSDIIPDVVETKDQEVTNRQSRRDAKSVADTVLGIPGGNNRQIKALVNALNRKEMAAHKNMLEEHYPPRSEHNRFLERVGHNVIKTTKELRTLVVHSIHVC